jgi:2,3-bisphosphoglycerate-independent phosphoglycerate mutase
MKHVIVIPDGCADEPQASLGDRTPLQAADLPAMDTVAREGLVGSANHVPDHLPAGSAVATLSLLGYDPEVHFTGRAPLEAAARKIPLAAGDWAIRCNLVTVQDQVMKDFTAGHVTTGQAHRILASLQQELGGDALEFIGGVSYRNLLIYRGQQQPAPFSRDSRSTPPHDLTGQLVVDDYPRGPGSDLLCELMDRSASLLKDHPVNRERAAQGLLPATNIWLWGLGQAPQLPSFLEQFGKRGLMITAVDLLRGIAALIGWEQVKVEGATGYTDTDFAAKGRAAMQALESVDLVCVHVEATDEASHEGDAQAKIKALEQIDQHIVAPLHAALRSQGEYRLLVTPDHPTPISTRTHTHGAVPFALAGSGIEADKATQYDESAAAASTTHYPQGHELMSFFLST